MLRSCLFKIAFTTIFCSVIFCASTNPVKRDINGDRSTCDECGRWPLKFFLCTDNLNVLISFEV